MQRVRFSTIVKLILAFSASTLIIFLVFTEKEDSKSGDRPCPAAITRYGAHIDLSHDTPQTSIPRRLHQIFKNSLIPLPYHRHMATWQRQNPDWQYFFWTDTSVKLMIKDKYPQYLELFESYEHRLQRSDAMRYFILHQYGGVYSDLDVEALKPMSSFLKSNTCVVVPEPRVQTNLIFNLDTALTNCIMATAAQHPFMEQVLRGLPKAYRHVKHNWDVLHSTGPFFLNRTYMDYQTKFPVCKKGSPCYVYVSDHKYLVPTFDVPDLKHNAENICKSSNAANRGKLQQKACDELLGTDFKNDLPREAVTNHLWLHLGWNPNNWLATKSICELVPEAITYDQIRVRTTHGGISENRL